MRLRTRARLTRVACSWVDGRFVHVLTPNIYRTLAEAMQTFDYITKTGNFGFMDRELARWSGVAIMVCARACSQCACGVPPLRLTWPAAHVAQYTLSHTRLKKRHNITDERAALYEEVRPAVARTAALCDLCRRLARTPAFRLANGRPRWGRASSWAASGPTWQARARPSAARGAHAHSARCSLRRHLLFWRAARRA